jgi:hypothetical protein
MTITKSNSKTRPAKIPPRKKTPDFKLKEEKWI